ncbi:MAG TPA: ABC transporter permease [Candidatus Limnocylindrales bacterium]|nr:ABC transporter permease [Candidatus Limnocylindrales bacterium]
MPSLAPNSAALGLAQALVAATLAFAAIAAARSQGIRLERESLVAMVRGLVQVVAVGAVLVIVLAGPVWMWLAAIVLMAGAAGATAARRAARIPGALVLSVVSIAVGSALVIVPMTLLGVIPWAAAGLVPVSSMIIANAMNTGALALDRLRAELLAHRGQTEAALALGASSAVAAQPYVRAAVTASLIPRVDTLRSLGIVWIPGVMAGMLLSGVDPVYAGVYQFAVLAMIFAAAAFTALAATVLARRRSFGFADELVIE